MSDDLIDRLRSPEEIVLPTGTRIILDNGKKMGRYWLELLEPFSVWVSSSLKMDAAAEIVQLRAENIHLRRAGMNRPSAELHEAALAELRDEITRLRARVEVLETVREAAQALDGYGFGWLHWDEKFEALRAALKEAKP